MNGSPESQLDSERDSEGDSSFDLSAGGAALVLEESGFRRRGRFLRRGSRAIDYQEITHLGLSSRGLWLGTRKSVLFLRRHRFRLSDGPERLSRALVKRISRRPGGLRQLERIAEIDHLAQNPSRRIATGSVALLCLAVFVLQMRDPFVQEVGAFVPFLVGRGELWRVATGNFLHAPGFFSLHLILNLLALMAIAFLVERPMGALRALVVMGASAVGAMGGSALAGYPEVVGASGIVAGLAGAALCLELHCAKRLPAWWRLPRRMFVLALVAEGFLGFLVPAIAGAAHLGGFLAGYGITLALADSALSSRPAARWIAVAAAGVVLTTILSFAAVSPLLLRDAQAFARYGQDLLAAPELGPGRYNELAWRMATETDASREQLGVALELAELAVDGTDRLNPDLLDTLAEVLFQRGERDLAVAVIDEAIALAPIDDYFQEQRRRFTGERAPDDRPDPPSLPWPYRRLPEWHTPGDPADGITI